METRRNLKKNTESSGYVLKCMEMYGTCVKELWRFVEIKTCGNCVDCRESLKLCSNVVKCGQMGTRIRFVAREGVPRAA